MRADTDELYKSRIIQFCRFHPEPDQAHSAALWLKDVAGIQNARRLTPHALSVVYDLRRVTLQGLEQALLELGYHLDNSLLCKLKRALFHYTEETQRENLAVVQESHAIQQEVFVNRYQQLPHGCRDLRPEYLREYQ